MHQTILEANCVCCLPSESCCTAWWSRGSAFRQWCLRRSTGGRRNCRWRRGGLVSRWRI